MIIAVDVVALTAIANAMRVSDHLLNRMA